MSADEASTCPTGPWFILASNSPRRRQLLAKAGYRFEVVSPPLDEPAMDDLEVMPAQIAESLAYFKARSVMDRIGPPVPVLGADTVVALDHHLFGKPIDADDARRILRILGSATHEVITGVALLDPSGARIIASDVTRVTMRPMSEQEMDEYIASGDWKGKAGAYGIQDCGDRYVERFDGSFSNVVGLPMELLKGVFGQLIMRHCT